MATSSAVPLREATGADIEVFVVLADDDHVDVVGLFALDRAFDAGEELNGAEVDILVKVEAEPQEDSFLEHTGGHARVADRAEQDRVAGSQAVDLGVGQDLAGPKVAFTAKVERSRLERDVVVPGDRGQDLEGFRRDFGTNTIPRDDAELDQNALRLNEPVSKFCAPLSDRHLRDRRA